MTGHASRVVQALVAAERQIALLDRVRPLCFASEMERLVACWKGGNEALPCFSYAPAVDLASTRRALEALVSYCDSLGAEGRWLAERACELGMDAQIVEAVGTAALGAVAEKRFRAPWPRQSDASRELDALLEAWSTEPVSEGASSGHLSDDRADESSLYAILVRRLGDAAASAPVRVERDLVAVAAVCGTHVVIRAGERLSRLKAQRIAEHEIVAHWLPRQNAQQRKDILRCGCSGASEDEEGRALVVEARANLMDPERRRELAFRHLAGSWSRQGADFVQVVRKLGGLGAPLRLRIAITMRAFRGVSFGSGAARCCLSPGGLGRELVYLPSYLRLRAAFAESPSLESWFELGRASLRYAQAQAPLGVGGASSTQTGT